MAKKMISDKEWMASGQAGITSRSLQGTSLAEVDIFLSRK